MNTEDETVLNYFDELEIHPEHIGNNQFGLFVSYSCSLAVDVVVDVVDVEGCCCCYCVFCFYKAVCSAMQVSK